MNEREELYDVLDEFHKRISTAWTNVENKKDITNELRTLASDFYDFKETYKKIEAPNDKSNASN